MPHNSTRPWRIALHEHSLQFKAPREDDQHPTPPDRERGDISGFSQSSRRRLIKKILRMESSRLSEGRFLTLTYHNEWPEDREDLKDQLNALLQSFRRRWPSMRYIWRVELQKRGAPHFHLMIWRAGGHEWEAMDEMREWLVETWQRISGCTSEAHAQYGVDLQRLQSWRKATAYVSKYVAKSTEIDSAPRLGRRWGASQSLPTSPHLRLHMNERAGHVLRRLCRKLLRSKSSGKSRLADHLREARQGLVGMEGATIDKMLAYLQQRVDCRVRAGPGPPPRSDAPEALAEQVASAEHTTPLPASSYRDEDPPRGCPRGGTEGGPSALHRAAPSSVVVHSWE